MIDPNRCIHLNVDPMRFDGARSHCYDCGGTVMILRVQFASGHSDAWQSKMSAMVVKAIKDGKPTSCPHCFSRNEFLQVSDGWKCSNCPKMLKIYMTVAGDAKPMWENT